MPNKACAPKVGFYVKNQTYNIVFEVLQVIYVISFFPIWMASVASRGFLGIPVYIATMY